MSSFESDESELITVRKKILLTVALTLAGVLLLLILPWAVDAVIYKPYEFKEVSQVQEKMQVPEDTLAELSDTALVRTVITYPKMWLMATSSETFEHPNERYGIIRDYFNGMQELERRYLEDPEKIADSLRREQVRFGLIQATDWLAGKQTQSDHRLQYQYSVGIGEYLRDRAAGLYE